MYQGLDPDGFFCMAPHALDFAQNGFSERLLIDWALELIDSNKTFVDIGAHVGTYSTSFAAKCNKVVSFEACPKTFNYLCANIALRGLDYTVTPHRVALGSEEGTSPFYIHSGGGGGNTCVKLNDTPYPKIEVPMRTLDSFQIDNIGLIKIDVEGFEKNVLQGGLETLKRSGYPAILFESWAPWRDQENVPATAIREELFAYIRTIGYRIVPLTGLDEMFLAERA
jgi:FkbM family methyltransferase